MRLDRLKSFIATYESSLTHAAVLDLGLRLQWCNRADFFGSNFNLLMHTEQITDFPIKRERILRLKLQSKYYSAKLLPYYDEVEIIGYLLFVYDNDQLHQIIENSSFRDNVNTLLRISNENIAQIVSISTLLESSLTDTDKQLVGNQIACASKLMSQLMNLTYYYSDEQEGKGFIDLNAQLKAVVGECGEQLKKIDREIIFSAPKSPMLIRLSEKHFMLIIMNLLQNALMYSEPKSPVGISLDCRDKVAVMVITNHGGARRSGDEAKRVGIGIPIAKRLIIGCGGTVEFDRLPDLGMKVTITIPLSEESGDGALGASLSSYPEGRFTPAAVFLSEIIENELNDK